MVKRECDPGWDRVRLLFSEQQRRGLFPGGQLVVRRNGQLLLDEAVGVARGFRASEGEPPTPVCPETRFQVMSASKPVVSIAIALLEEKFGLRVDTPIASLWPEFAAHGKEQLTVLDVLTHRSGVLPSELDAAPEKWADWQGLASAIAALEPRYRRGTQAYSPLGYGWILAEVVRRVTGSPLPDFLAAQFPEELQGVQLLRQPSPSPVARTYWLGGAHHFVGGNDIAPRFEAINNDVSGVTALVPGGALFTTARTLALFYEALAAGGLMPSSRRLLAEGTLQRYTERALMGWDRSAHSFVVLGRGFARGWWLPHAYAWSNSGACFGHPGGYSVVAFADAGLCAGIAIVTNGNRSLSDLVRRSAPLGSAIRRALRRSAAEARP